MEAKGRKKKEGVGGLFLRDGDGKGTKEKMREGKEGTRHPYQLEYRSRTPGVVNVVQPRDRPIKCEDL